jgi:uncharacterized protein
LKLLDANILLYAYDSVATHHSRCCDWLERSLNDDEQVGLPWQTIMAFVRIATNPRVMRAPMASARACETVERWLALPRVVLVEPGDRYWQIFSAQVQAAQISGPLVTDAALAALAIEQGATLCTTDRDFRRFDGLKVFDPTR